MAKRVFISQPMNGKTVEQIRKDRQYAVNDLERNGFEVVDSVVNSPEDAKNKPMWCLSKSIEILSKCDCVYFMDGWDKARGCKIEHDIALAYGMPIVEKENANGL